MKVIGAGLPRTATLSQHAAMEILGFKPVYHMATLFERGQGGDWREVLDGKRSAAELLSSYDATVDWPGSYYTKDLAEAFPEAKIVLSERDPEVWAQSMVKTIWGLFYADSLMRHLSDARMCIDPGWRSYLEMMNEMWHNAGLFDDGANTTPEHLAQAFVRRNEELKAALPAERVLVWAGEGRLGAAVRVSRGAGPGSAVPADQRLGPLRRVDDRAGTSEDPRVPRGGVARTAGRCRSPLTDHVRRYVARRRGRVASVREALR